MMGASYTVPSLTNQGEVEPDQHQLNYPEVENVPKVSFFDSD